MWILQCLQSICCCSLLSPTRPRVRRGHYVSLYSPSLPTETFPGHGCISAQRSCSPRWVHTYSSPRYDFAAVGRWWSRGPLACAVGHTRFELFVKVSYNAYAVSLRHFLEDSFQVRQSVVLRGLDSPPVWYVDGDNKYMAGWVTKPYPTYALTFWSKRLEFLSGSTR